MHFWTPTDHFFLGGVKIQKILFFITIAIFLWCILRPQWPHFDTWMANGCQIQKQHTKSTLRTQKPEKWHDVIKGDWPLMTSEVNVSVNHGCHIPTPIHVGITSINAEIRKFQALKRYGTQISLDMTSEIRSQVKGHSRYGLKIFSEGIKMFKG